MSELIVCEVCHRHVKGADAACPFCGSKIPEAQRSIGLAGAAVVGLAIAIAACTSTTGGSGGGGAGGTTVDGGGHGGQPVAAYGPPPPLDGGVGGAYGPPPPPMP